MTKYVLGFLFDDDLGSVVLIKKTHPEWQAGKHNGVGGKVEGVETLFQAMEREFLEETGVSGVDWQLFGRMGSSSSWACWLFCARDSEAVEKVATKTDEEVVVINRWRFLSIPKIPNLDWIIPFAMDALSNKENPPVFIEAAWP